MSYIYSYTKELVSIAQDPKERAAAIKVRRITTRVQVQTPRIRSVPEAKPDVTVPLTYLAASRIKEWKKRL